MEVIERYKVTIQKAAEKTKIDTIRKLRVQVIHLKVDLVEMLVDKGHQGLLDNHQLVGSMVKESIEGISLTPHAHIIVAPGELLSDDPGGEDTLSLGHNDNIHLNILWHPDGGPEVSGQGHQQMEDGDNVFSMD